MKNLAVWFEIPVKDIEQTKKFYHAILQVEIHVQKMGDSLMGFFPMAGYANSGALVQGDQYEPSGKGTIVYLNGGDDLNNILQRVEPAGGKILMPKTHISQENGYFAVFLDPEGNKVGLHSMG